MPIYSEVLNVPANTSEDSPVSLDIKIKQRYISHMEIGFPDGCNYKVKVRIQYGIKVFWPERVGTWIIGNNETIRWDERFTMPSINETLTVYGISPEATYDHDVVIRIMTLPKGFYFLETLLNRLYNIFKKIF